MEKEFHKKYTSTPFVFAIKIGVRRQSRSQMNTAKTTKQH